MSKHVKTYRVRWAGLVGNLRAINTYIKKYLQSENKPYALRNQKESKQKKPKASRMEQ